MQFGHFTSSNFGIILFQLAREIPLSIARGAKSSAIPPVIEVAPRIPLSISAKMPGGIM